MAAEQDGPLERVVDEVSETATRAVTFVGRLGSAFGDGLRDARAEAAAEDAAEKAAEQDEPAPAP